MIRMVICLNVISNLSGDRPDKPTVIMLIALKFMSSRYLFNVGSGTSTPIYGSEGERR